MSEVGAMTRGPNGDAASSDFDQTGFSPSSETLTPTPSLYFILLDWSAAVQQRSLTMSA